MKPFVILLSVFVIALLTTRIIHGNYEFPLSGRIAMSSMLLFTAIAHFVFPKGMEMMIPPQLRYRKQIVYLTGIIEIAAAIGLLIPDIRIVTAWFLIAFFIMIAPANIYAAIKRIDYQKGSFEGNGPVYLWFRIPLQILFILWTYLAAIKSQ